MTTLVSFKRNVACTLITLFLFSILAPANAYADVVGTGEVITEQQLTVDRDMLVQKLNRDDVRAELERYGVDPDQALERVAAMTDAEIRELNAGLDQHIVAGQPNITLTTALLIIIIVLILI